MAQAIAAGTADPGRAGERLLAAAGWDRERLERARSLLIRRLQVRSSDFEATLALRILERALQRAPDRDGPWRWQRQLSPRRLRATRRRAARRRTRSYGRRRTRGTAAGIRARRRFGWPVARAPTGRQERNSPTAPTPSPETARLGGLLPLWANSPSRRGLDRPAGREEWAACEEVVISGSVLFRHPRSLVVVLLAIAALTAVALDRLGDAADRHRQAVLVFTRLQVVTKSLEVAQERLGTAELRETPALMAETRALFARADAELRQLEDLGADRSGAVVRERLEGYRLSIEDELGLVAAGRRTEARALDEAVVDVRFESFEDRLDELAEEWAGRARKVERTRRVGSATALMVAASLIAATVLRFVHARERVRTLEEQRQRLSHRATHDSLTGLANRERFAALVDHALRDGTRPAVAFVDLDGFKDVNDRFGHSAGDVLLQVAAERIRSVVRSEDVAGRLGGDEFAVLLSTSSRTENAAVVAERIGARLAEPFSVDGRTVMVGASVGLAFGGGGDDADGLLRRADAAMYAAKRAGKGRLVIDAAEPNAERSVAVDLTRAAAPGSSTPLCGAGGDGEDRQCGEDESGGMDKPVVTRAVAVVLTAASWPTTRSPAGSRGSNSTGPVTERPPG